VILLTLGDRGLAVGQEGCLYHVQVPKMKSGHAVGSGDAALAGFIAGWARKADLVTIARLAAACGAANLLSDVPGGISKNAVERIAAKLVVEEL
jgi:fructose-1-phosphate kinase PfkB-like protein